MLKTRIITGLVLAALALAGLYYLPPLGFAVAVAGITLVAAWEWAGLAGVEGPVRPLFTSIVGFAILAFFWLLPFGAIYYLLIFALAFWMLAAPLVATYPDSARFWTQAPMALTIGLVALTAFFAALWSIRQSSLVYWDWIGVLLVVVWGMDTGAYFVGKAFGRLKLAERISPGKSWEGLAAGIVTGIAVAAAWMHVTTQGEFFTWDAFDTFLVFCGMIAAMSVLGDLIVSGLKRERGMKDSSSLLPGHGGLLDRIDSLIAAAPFWALLWADWPD